MPQLQKGHFKLFRMLNDRFLFLNRNQISRILILPTSTANRWLLWLTKEKYLERRRRADTFSHFQMPLYYLGLRAWRMMGNSPEDYKEYRARIEERADVSLEHLIAAYDVLLKFTLEGNVKRIIQSDDRFWHESLSFEVIPDAWIEYDGGEAFIEVDRGTESREVVIQKLEKYITLEESGRHKILFPGTTFRVLFVTTTEKRIESLEQLTRSDDIWYATMEEFLREPLDHQHWFARLSFYALPLTRKKEMQEMRQA